MRKMRKSAAVALTAAMAVTSMGVIPAMADETTTIRVMLWDRGDAPQGMTVEENKMSEWINEQVADLGLQVEFVAVPRSTSEDVLTTMMTGGNAPDIIFSYDQNVFLNYAQVFDTYIYERGIVSGQYSVSAAAGLFKSIVSLILVLSANKIAKLCGESGFY